MGESLCEEFVRCSWDAIIGEDKNDVVDDGGGIRRWEVLVGEGRFVPVCDGLNAEVQADPSSTRQNTAVVVLVVVVRARRCFILQGMERLRMMRREKINGSDKKRSQILLLFARYMNRDDHSNRHECCASGLVVKFNVAIVEPRVRFSAGACPTLLPPRSVLLALGGLVWVLGGVGVDLGRLVGSWGMVCGLVCGCGRVAWSEEGDDVPTTAANAQIIFQKIQGGDAAYVHVGLKTNIVAKEFQLNIYFPYYYMYVTPLESSQPSPEVLAASSRPQQSGGREYFHRQ